MKFKLSFRFFFSYDAILRKSEKRRMLFLFAVGKKTSFCCRFGAVHGGPPGSVSPSGAQKNQPHIIRVEWGTKIFIQKKQKP